MFKTRLLSGILLVVIALATIIPGNDILLALLLLVSLIGMSELYKVRNLHVSLPGIVGYAAAAACLRADPSPGERIRRERSTCFFWTDRDLGFW